MVGKGYYEDLTSMSKTTNGVGSAYGDGSYINMSPYQSQVNDPDMINRTKAEYVYQPQFYPSGYMNPHVQTTYPIQRLNYPHQHFDNRPYVY